VLGARLAGLSSVKFALPKGTTDTTGLPPPSVRVAAPKDLPGVCKRQYLRSEAQFRPSNLAVLYVRQRILKTRMFFKAVFLKLKLFLRAGTGSAKIPSVE
jgi:hypothetical protein